MKKKFNLEEWLMDKSQKVVTKENIPVVIFTTDFNGDGSNILCGRIGSYECPSLWTSQGYYTDEGYPHRNNLFLVTDEPELTEFEKALADIIDYAISTAQTEPDKPTAEFAKGYAESLLDIASKQFEKDLPKWKKWNPNGKYGITENAPTGFFLVEVRELRRYNDEMENKREHPEGLAITQDCSLRSLPQKAD